NVQELCLAGGAVVVDGGFDEAAGVVEVVLLAVVAAIGAPAVGGLAELGVGVDVPVGVFGGGSGDAVDVAVDALLELRVGVLGEEIGGAGERLVDQAVVPLRAAVCDADTGVADVVKVGQGAVFFELVEAVGDGDLAPGVALGGPEGIVDPDMTDRHRR